MKYLKHYLILAAILSLGFGLFWIFNYNRTAQIWITLILGVVYVIWGIVHHGLRHEFHWQIIWEYLIVATLVSLVVTFLLIRA